MPYLMIKVLKLTNDIVRFEQLGPELYCICSVHMMSQKFSPFEIGFKYSRVFDHVCTWPLLHVNAFTATSDKIGFCKQHRSR